MHPPTRPLHYKYMCLYFCDVLITMATGITQIKELFVVMVSTMRPILSFIIYLLSTDGGVWLYV